MVESAKDQDRWRGHPWLARALRVLIFLIPISLSVTVSLLAAHFIGPIRLGVNKWLWWAVVAVVSTVVLLVADHLARRLLPLTALLKMTLIFPDAAPSRFGLAMRTGTTKQLERLVEHNKVSGPADNELGSAATMLELVAALSAHDRLTRGHCERVRAYTDLVIKEMHLPERDANLLRWAALLHDIGKLRVPSEILSSDRRPTDDEWEILATHPAEGMALTEALADWLGEWRRTIGEHHERWDGNGYPNRLVREHIHLGARIVAVTDAFDVMTSARSYKKPIPAAVARQEIARCAASQFDPIVVRAFLNVGLRRLRFALGPLAWISNIPFLGQAPLITAASNAIGGVATASILAVATATAAAPAIVAPQREQAIEQQSVATFEMTAPDVDISGRQGQPLIVRLHGAAETRVTLAIATAPQHGEALVSRQPDLPVQREWVGEVVVTPQAEFAGRDQLAYEVCDPARMCRSGTVRITVAGLKPTQDTTLGDATTSLGSPPPDSESTITTGGGTQESTRTTAAPSSGVPSAPPSAVSPTTTGAPAPSTSTTPTAAPPTATRAPSTTTTSTTTSTPTSPTPSTTTLATTSTTPPPTGTTSVAVTTSSTSTTTTLPTTTLPTTTTIMGPLAPIAIDDNVAGIEDQSLVTPLADLTLNDTDPNGAVLTISSVHDAVHGSVQMTSTHAVFVPDPDFFGVASFAYTVCDPGNLCADATVSVLFSPVADAPRPLNDDYVVVSGSVLNVAAPGVLANDLEPDGEQLSVEPGVSVTSGGSLAINTDGSFTYTPTPLFAGQDTAAYSVCDTTGLCANATITVTVTPAPPSTQALYFTGLGSPQYALSSSAPPVANPEPDTPGDGDRQPGLTLKKDSRTGYVWTYTLDAATHYAGPIALDVWSAMKNFNTTEQGTLAAQLYECDGAGNNCSLLLQRQWTNQPWNVGGSASWTERVLTLGTIDRIIAAGQRLQLVLTASQRDLWVALSGDRPSSLLLTS